MFNAKTNLFRHPTTAAAVNSNEGETDSDAEESDNTGRSSSRRRSSAAISHYYTLRTAVEAGIIDAHRTLIYDDSIKTFITLHEAIKNGCVEPVSARIRTHNNKNMKNVPPALVGDDKQHHGVGLLQGLESGYVCDSAGNDNKSPLAVVSQQRRPPTLAQLIEQGCYEQHQNGDFRIRNSEACGGLLLTLSEAVERGVVLAYEPTVKHPYYERRVLSLMTAVSIGLIDGERGVMKLPPKPNRPGTADFGNMASPNQSDTIDLVKAKERGLLLNKVPDSVHYV